MSKNLFLKITTGLIGVVICTAQGHAAQRDQTVDYFCRPKWDKYIVDEKTTDWDPNSMLCYDKHGNKVDPALVYGKPSLYGEYDPSVGAAESTGANLYGDPSGIVAKHLYGEPVNVVVKPKAAPVRTAAPMAKSGKPKPIVVAKTIKPKKTQKPSAPIKVKPSPKPVVATPVVRATDPAPVVVQPIIVPAKPAVAVVNPGANMIAQSLRHTVDADFYCQEINPPVKGPMPAGLVLMPGRPDRMSCVKK